MPVSAVTHSNLSIGQNVQVKTPLWKRVALLVGAVAVTIFTLGLALCSTRVLGWYKEFWSGYSPSVVVKSKIHVENKHGGIAICSAEVPPKTLLAQAPVQHNQANANGLPSLIKTVKNPTDVVVEPIKKEDDISLIDKEGNTALHLAKNAAEVGKLLDKAPHLIETVNAKGNTPLLQAVSDDCQEVVLELLARGAKIDAKNKDGNNLLHLTKSVAVAEKLIDKAAHLIEDKNAEGKTPYEVVELEVALEMLGKQYKLPTGTKEQLQRKAATASVKATRQKQIQDLDALMAAMS